MERFVLKEFAKNATNNGVFGSYTEGGSVPGAGTYATTPEQVMSLPAWLTGWLDATNQAEYQPLLPEMQGLQWVISKALKEVYKEGIPVWNANEEYYQYSFVAYTPEGDEKPILYYNVTGTYTATSPDLDTTNWAVWQQETSSYALSLGDVMPIFTLNNAGAGRVWADGTEYTKAAFPDVYNALVEGDIQSLSYSDYSSQISSYGACAKFALDATNEVFKVPTMKDVYVGSTLSESLQGTYVAAGLPNITGSVGQVGNVFNPSGDYAQGAFQTLGGTHRESDGNNHSNGGFSFDASRSSSIYGNSDTVTPPTVLARWAVVMFADAVPASTAQAAEFINSLTSKANADGSNISEAETFRNNIEAPCMPKRVISATATSSQIGDIVGINENSGANTYTLPSGGTWFCYVYKNNNTSQALSASPRGVIAAGGTTLSLLEGGNGYLYGMAWRIA